MSTPDRPDRMYRWGRPIDTVFVSDERLYRRCVGNEIRQGNVFADQIPFYPDMSVSRSKYSFPEDVLYPDFFAQCGVFSFGVHDIPASYSSDKDTHYEWKPEHDPQDDNFAHTEVRTYKNGLFTRGLNIGSKVVKKYFRELLQDRSRIDIAPGEAIGDIHDARPPPTAS
ncbi:MAG: hypothetical protein M3Y56_10030 [Armatimonadota bacterium]|nr:hypothetical protein [Armatimonadota bacterium]